jgi:Ca2+-binding EF-hand superfamily protein
MKELDAKTKAADVGKTVEEVKKVEQEAVAAEASVILAEKVPEAAKMTWKNARAQKKFKELDTDGSGNLEEAEMI